MNVPLPQPSPTSGRVLDKAKTSIFFPRCVGEPTVIPQTNLELNAGPNSSRKQPLFHDDFLVPGRVQGLVSLFFWHSVSS